MKNTVILFLLTAFITFSTQAQVNEFEVNILSPLPNQTLDTNAKINISAIVINRGPNIVSSTDKILFNIKVGSNDSTVFIDTSIFVGRLMQIDDAITYNIVDSIGFYGTNRYEVCVSVKGSIAFPTNSSKNPGPCVGVLVNQKEIPNKISKLFYANGTINFNLEKPVNSGEVQILSITGKELLRTRLSGNLTEEIAFNPRANGIYFVKVYGDNSQATISKFIVH